MDVTAMTGADGSRWRVVAHQGPGADGLVAAVQSASRRTVLRDTASRRVERVDVAGGAVLVKTYLARGFLESLWRRVAGRPPADIELDAGVELARRGFDVAEPLAAGRSGGAGMRESTLITRFVDGARVALDIAHDRGTPLARRRALIGALGALVSRMHQSGVVHEDLHLGNLLVDESAEPPRLILIDVRRVRFSQPIIATPAIVESLASLFVASYGLASRSDRLRFLRGYLGGLETRDVATGLARMAGMRGNVLMGALARRRALSAVTGDSRYERRVAGSDAWIVRRAVTDAALGAVLADPESAAPGGEFVLRKTSRPALDVLATAALLEGLCIPASRVMAAGASGAAARVLVLPRVRGALPFADAMRARPAGLAAAYAAGALLAKLHAFGIGHRALSMESFDVLSDGSLMLVDIENVDARMGSGTALSDMHELGTKLAGLEGPDAALAAALLDGHRTTTAHLRV